MTNHEGVGQVIYIRMKLCTHVHTHHRIRAGVKRLVCRALSKRVPICRKRMRACAPNNRTNHLFFFLFSIRGYYIYFFFILKLPKYII